MIQQKWFLLLLLLFFVFPTGQSKSTKGTPHPKEKRRTPMPHSFSWLNAPLEPPVQPRGGEEQDPRRKGDALTTQRVWLSTGRLAVLLLSPPITQWGQAGVPQRCSSCLVVLSLMPEVQAWHVGVVPLSMALRAGTSQRGVWLGCASWAEQRFAFC